MIKRILVAGASGQVGLELISYLKKKYKIIATYNKTKKNLFKDKNIKWIKIDFSKKNVVKSRFEYIINCIASHEFTRKISIKKYVESNILCTKNLVFLGIKKKIKLFINFSTISVYGIVDKKILNENYKKKEQNILGITKLIGENIVKYSSLNYVNLRLPGIITKTDSIRPWLNKIAFDIKNSKKINLFNLNDKFNSLIDVFELNKIVHLILKKKKIRSEYNVSASKPIKINNIIKYLKNRFGSSSRIIIKKSKTNSFLISTKKIKKELNYNAPSANQIIKRNFD